jgi:large subunit ribosomal protein L20
MSRIKRGVMHAKRRRNLLAKTKGYMWGRKSKIKLAKVAVLKAGVNAYRGRKQKKRDFRSLWTVRLNAATREHGMSYSKFIDALHKANVELDRKVLAAIALEHPAVFAKIVAEVKK